MACVLSLNGVIVDGIGKRITASSALVVEPFAIRKACFMLNARNISKAWIASDCKILIYAIRSSETPLWWEITAIVLNIRNLSRGKLVSWNFIVRKFNSVTNWVAKEALRGHLTPNWVSSPPVELDHLFLYGAL